jgi:hypothetical protein
MNSPKPKLPEINEEDRTPLGDVLLEVLAWQQKQIDTITHVVSLKGNILNNTLLIAFKT